VTTLRSLTETTLLTAQLEAKGIRIAPDFRCEQLFRRRHILRIYEAERMLADYGCIRPKDLQHAFVGVERPSIRTDDPDPIHALYCITSNSAVRNAHAPVASCALISTL
jgi:hypothetical protein